MAYMLSCMRRNLRGSEFDLSCLYKLNELQLELGRCPIDGGVKYAIL